MEGELCMAGLAAESAHPLLRAVFLRRLRLTRLLLEGGAYINESDGHGQTPLMVACRTQHDDAQSASRARLVQYLLKRGADPNIQDTAGRSALMHACRERAGPEVVSSLLGDGADVGLEDRSGSSSLVYAVLAGDHRVLALLLSTCKAQGKEVIIIATDKLPRGRLQPAQHLSVCSLAPPAGHADAAAPCSPSDVRLTASPRSSPEASDKPVFSFSSAQHGRPQQQPLLRLNSELWLKVPAACALAQKPQHHPDAHVKEEVEHAGPGTLRGDNGPQRWDEDHRRVDSLNKHDRMLMGGGEGKGECGKPRGSKISLPGLVSCHSSSHPDLRSQSLAAHPGHPFPSFPLCSKTALDPSLSPGLRGIIARRRLGADHYSSDPQLAGQKAEGRRALLSRSSTLLGSGDSLEATGPASRLHAGMERRGSEALLLGGRVSQCRPRCLPPLHLHGRSQAGNAGIPIAPGNGDQGGRDACSAAGMNTLLPSAPPGPPREVGRRMLSRRHSMQTTA